MRRSTVSAAVIALGLVMLLQSQAVFSAVPPPLLTTTLTAQSVVQTTFQGNQAVSVNYTDTTSTSMIGVVWLSVQNNMGQTVGLFVSTADLSGAQTSQLIVVIYGLPSGQYTGTLFAVTTTGVPISSTTSVHLTL